MAGSEGACGAQARAGGVQRAAARGWARREGGRGVCAPLPWEGWRIARPVYHDSKADSKAVTFITMMATQPTGYSLLRPQ